MATRLNKPSAAGGCTPRRLSAVMETACAAVVTLSLPLVVDVGQGEDWRAAH